MARAENQKEEIIHVQRLGDRTRCVVRTITDSQGRNFLDVRQAFVTEDEFLEFAEADLPWHLTRNGFRLDQASIDAIGKVKLPKNPVDTKTVKTTIDNSIKLPAKENGAAAKKTATK
jgi:hypothetical protein